MVLGRCRPLRRRNIFLLKSHTQRGRMIRDSFGGADIRGEAATLPIVGIHVTEKGEGQRREMR